MKDFFKTIARMFTIPRSVRALINANPVAPVVKALAAAELAKVIPETLSLHIDNPEAVSALSQAISHAIDATGVLK